MYHKANSTEYNTCYLSWPEIISRRCYLCGHPVKFAHSGNGKLVYILNETLHQVVNYYTCPNPKCENHAHYFNPAIRYDFNQSHLGKDVLNKIAREIFVFKQNPEQLHLRLTLDYQIDISLRQVQRIYTDLLAIKANKIDENTYTRIKEQKGIILCMDGADPGAGLQSDWIFTDAISGRLLHDQLSKSTPAEKLRDIIKSILKNYNTQLLGVVSDKQNNLTNCMNTYFKGIPHQYCTFHFCGHLWGHLEVFDTQIYSHLKSVIHHLYIHTTSQQIQFESIGLEKISVVFAGFNSDLEKMLRYRNKKFHFLRGLALYRTLKRYLENMKQELKELDEKSRFMIILKKTYTALEEGLNEVSQRFSEDLFMYDTFKLIYHLFYNEIWFRVDRQKQLDDIFGKCWALAKIKEPTLILEDLRSFNPIADSTCGQILGEWVRLWNSYLPGLFSYYDFPIDIRTNVAQERAFSKEKSDLVRRMANKEVGFMQELQGDLYLRLCHCDSEELLSDIVQEYLETEVKVLQNQYHEKMAQISAQWFYKAEPLADYKKSITRFGILKN